MHLTGNLFSFLTTKFKVCNFIRSKDIKRYQKIRKCVTEMTFKRHSVVTGNNTVRWSAYDFLLAFL